MTGWHIAMKRPPTLKSSHRDTGAAVLASRPELSARLAAARVQGLAKQLAECREALRRKSAELSAVAHEAAQLRKERAQLRRHAASLEAQVLSLVYILKSDGQGMIQRCRCWAGHLHLHMSCAVRDSLRRRPLSAASS